MEAEVDEGFDIKIREGESPDEIYFKLIRWASVEGKEKLKNIDNLN